MVEAAHRELVTLSEWLRRAAEVRVTDGLTAAGSTTAPTVPRAGNKAKAEMRDGTPRLAELAAASPTGELTGADAGPSRGRAVSPEEGRLSKSSGSRASVPASPPALVVKPQRCVKEPTHHIYHSGKPCPSCGYPKTKLEDK